MTLRLLPPLLVLCLSVFATTATAELSLTITTDATSYVPGSVVRASRIDRNTAGSGLADLYVGALLPDRITVILFTSGGGHILSSSVSHLTSWTPLASNLDLSQPFSLQVPKFFEYQWTGAEPEGIYTLFALALHPGALSDNSLEPHETIALSTSTLAFGSAPEGICPPWPPQACAFLANVAVPDGLLFVRESPRPGPGEFGEYRTNPPTVIFRKPGDFVGEAGIIAHELCHANQHRAVIDHQGFIEADLLTSWSMTPQGVDFIQRSGWRFEGGSWMPSDATGANTRLPHEDAAFTCQVWFDASRVYGPTYLQQLLPSRFGWAQQWLVR